MNIVLYIQNGSHQDKFIKDYLEIDKVQDNFTIIRTRDELNFMLGCLYTKSNKMVYASEFKHSMSEELYKLINPDLKSKNKPLKHVILKEILKNNERSDYLKLFQKIIPECIDLTQETFISEPIGCK